MKLVKNKKTVISNDANLMMIPTEKKAAENLAEICFMLLRRLHEEGNEAKLAEILAKFNRMLRFNHEEAFYYLMNHIKEHGRDSFSDISVALCWERDDLMKVYNAFFSELSHEYIEAFAADIFSEEDDEDECGECECRFCKEDDCPFINPIFIPEMEQQLELNLNVDNLVLNVSLNSQENEEGGEVDE